MKIVDVAEYYSENGGGIRTYIQAKMRIAEKHGHEVVVVAPGPEDGEEEKYGGRIVWVKGPPVPFYDAYSIMWNMRAVHRVLDREKPDILEGSSVWAGGQFAARWKGDCPRALIFHQDPVAVVLHTSLDKFVSRNRIDSLSSPIWRYIKSLSKRYDATMVSGKWLANRLDDFGVHAPIATPFGIDKSIFSPAKRSEAKREELLKLCGLGPEASLCVIVSRFHPEKRLGVVLDAFLKLQETRSAGLVVFGTGFMSEKLQSRFHEAQGVHIAGFTKDREELAQVYASSDVMLHGSAAETFGLGVAEAICSGLPIVAPSVGGAADLVGSGCGLQYEPGDVAGCAQAAGAVLDEGRDHWLTGLAGRAETIYTVDQHFEELFKRYEAML